MSGWSRDQPDLTGRHLPPPCDQARPLSGRAITTPFTQAGMARSAPRDGSDAAQARRDIVSPPMLAENEAATIR